VLFTLVRFALHRLDNKFPRQGYLLRQGMGWNLEEKADDDDAVQLQRLIRRALSGVTSQASGGTLKVLTANRATQTGGQAARPNANRQAAVKAIMTTENHPAQNEASAPESNKDPDAKALQLPDERKQHACPTPVVSGATPPETPNSSGDEVNLFLFVLVLAMVVMTALVWLPGLTRWAKNSVITPQGTVQRITFVKGLGVSSQVDTEQRSFLVRGVTQLRKGARVETRSGPLGSRLCDADSLICDELMRDE